jgi:hypothetical protein
MEQFLPLIKIHDLLLAAFAHSSQHMSFWPPKNKIFSCIKVKATKKPEGIDETGRGHPITFFCSHICDERVFIVASFLLGMHK